MTEGEVSLATADDKCSKHLSALVVMATFLSVGGVVIVNYAIFKTSFVTQFDSFFIGKLVIVS